jgi:hypothetical protein
MMSWAFLPSPSSWIREEWFLNYSRHELVWPIKQINGYGSIVG